MRIAVAAVAAAACGELEGVSSTGDGPGRGFATGTAVVTFTFDDGFDSQLLAARILEGDPGTPPEDSFRGTFFIVSGALRRPGDGPGRLTPGDVQALAAAGHEIGGHTLGHVSLGPLLWTDPYELGRQICNDRRALDALGVHPVGFAYPRADDLGVHDAVRDCGYTYGRDAEGLVLPAHQGPHAEAMPPLDRLGIRVLESISAAAPPGDRRHEASKASVLEDWIASVIGAGGGWVTIIVHHLRDGCGDLAYCMEERELRAFVAWLRAHPPGVEVRTMDQVVLGDPRVANPSLEVTNPGSSPPRPLCFRRVGRASNFPSIVWPAPGHSGGYAEILRPTNAVPDPMIQIDPLGRGCSLPVTPGRRYQARVFVRGGGAARIAAQILVGETWLSVPGPPRFVPDAWAPLAFTVTAPPGATALVFGAQHAGGEADVVVDDFAVVER